MSSPPRRWQVFATTGVLLLSAASSLLGLLRPGLYAGAPSMVARTRAEDLSILAVAVPVLAIGLYYAIRRSGRGRVVWLGGLAFATYLWASRAVSLPFGALFLGYVALVPLSLFPHAGGLLETDAATIRRLVRSRRSPRVYAVVIAFIAVGLAALWLSDVVPATLAGEPPATVAEFGQGGLGTVAIDLGLVVPSLAVTAAWLWRDRPPGYVTAGVLLVFGALLAPSLAAITVVDVASGVAMTPGLVVGTVVPPLVAAAFAVRYLLAIPPGAAG